MDANSAHKLLEGSKEYIISKCRSTSMHDRFTEHLLGTTVDTIILDEVANWEVTPLKAFNMCNPCSHPEYTNCNTCKARVNRLAFLNNKLKRERKRSIWSSRK